MKKIIYTSNTHIICLSSPRGKIEWQLTFEQIAALREAGEKMSEALRAIMADIGSWKNCEDAVTAWEAANK